MMLLEDSITKITVTLDGHVDINKDTYRNRMCIHLNPASPVSLRQAGVDLESRSQNMICHSLTAL